MTAVETQGVVPAAADVSQDPAKPLGSRGRVRIGLFFKYVALSFAVVLVALITNGAFEVWFSYQEYKSSLIRIQSDTARWNRSGRDLRP